MALWNVEVPITSSPIILTTQLQARSRMGLGPPWGGRAGSQGFGARGSLSRSVPCRRLKLTGTKGWGNGIRGAGKRTCWAMEAP